MDLNCSAKTAFWPYVSCEIVNWGVPFIAVILIIGFYVSVSHDSEAQRREQEAFSRTSRMLPPLDEGKGPRLDIAGVMERKGRLKTVVDRRQWLLAAAAILLLLGFITFLVLRQAIHSVIDAVTWDTKDRWDQQAMKP